MNPLTDMLGDNDAPWMQESRRNCNPGTDDPTLVRQHADLWDTLRPELARRLCTGCPVGNACLTYALADPSLEGVWGGTTWEERRQIRRNKEAAA